MPPRRKYSEASPLERELRSNKRLYGNDEGHVLEMEPTTPSKRRRRAAPKAPESNSPPADEATVTVVEATSDEAVETKPMPQLPKATTPRRSTRPEKPSTPKARFGADATPTRRALDLSARRKSARTLIEGAMRENAEDDDDDGDAVARLAQKIYDDSDAREESEQDEDDEAETAHGKAAVDDVSATPSKAPRRRKAKSPTPPLELPPHELYFLHNKPGRLKTSDNTLGTLALLTHEEYFSLRRQHEQRLQADVDYLEALHAESFPQWTFELLQGFSLCLYGYGSKRALMRRFAQHVGAQAGAGAKTVIVNGYAAAASMREILACVAAAVDGQQRVPAGVPAAMVHGIAARLAAAPDRRLTLVVNSIDAPPLRKPGAQAALAQLAALPQVRLVCSADTPDFPLLWDVSLRSAFNFVFHDCTTFAPLTAELDVVDDVHELLGRRALRAYGRDGVAYVLRSLPENAKNLLRLLVREVLVAMDDDDADAHGTAAGVEYRMLYNMAVEEFICTSEMAFRTLLKEFHDHQIITSRKDAIGTELLSLPFPKDELEAILEDLLE